MSGKNGGLGVPRGLGQRPASDESSRSEEDARSSILPPTLNSNGHDDPGATHSASPSGVEPTSTGDALPTAGHSYPRTSAAVQIRDPDRYLITGEHGRGGLGRVSRAHDRDLGRDVAIKELISRSNLSEVRFLREALITARLEHPGIVPVHEAGRWPDGTPFYAMKLVAGRPLRELIAERTTVAERIGLLHHVIAVADAIAYAHGRSIIHRDLKPANVIVGDFGETIVIDWGLAKNVSTTEEATIGGGPFRANHDSDLTTAGSVLGTPAYMAPEQERGEHVDQRADVFAIGAMLWEICSLQKVPPTEPHLRHRMLRRSGIGKDLITIIDKALEPDPRRRYTDAGGLAADLKAFKSGARIAARSYSLFAMLAHWTRRHRALAVSVAIAIVLGLIGSIIYVRDVRTERDRADAALAQVAATQHELHMEHAELTLKHAELLIITDPSAALDSLATYRGHDLDRANQLRAEAKGKGVALLRAIPHTDRIPWIQGVADGRIFSLSRDGTISRTSPDGTSVVLANNVAPNGDFAYASLRHLLAYVCDPSGLCMLDILNGKRVSIPWKIQGSQLIGIAFSPNGSQLATISQTGDLRVFDVTDPNLPIERLRVATTDGGGVLFVDEDAIAIGTQNGLKLVRLTGGITRTLTDPDGTFWAANPSDHQLAFATTRGQAYLAEANRLRIVTHATLCHGPISDLKVVPGQGMIAFTCKEGTVGTWRLADGTIIPRAHLDGHANMVEVSADGCYLVAAGDNGIATIVDLRTNLVTSLKGHRYRLSAIAPPTSEYPLLLSADVRGGIRTWPLPSRFSKVVGQARKRVLSAVYNNMTDMAIASMRGLGLITYSAAAAGVVVKPYTEDNAIIELAANGRSFVTYGQSTSVVLWSALTMTPRRVFDTVRSSVSRVAFIGDTDEIVVSGRDGRLTQWTPAGEQRIIHQFDQPIETFTLVGQSRIIVLGTSDGELWKINEQGDAVSLRNQGVRITRMLALPDGVSVCIGYANGEVIVVETSSWRQWVLLRAPAAIRDLAVTNDNQTVAIVDNDGTVHVGTKHGLGWKDARVLWSSLTMNSRKVVFTTDGLLMTICPDGSIWIYSLTRRTWLSLIAGTVDLTHIVISKSGDVAVVFDADGRVISVEMKAVRRILEASR